MFIRLVFAFFLIVFLQPLKAAVKLPPILADNLILKQNSRVKLWGEANPGSVVEVSVSWSSRKFTGIADENGRFSLNVPTGRAGGPYTVTFREGEEKTVVKNVLLGEVWFCSGQSNMEMALKGFGKDPILNSEEIIKSAENKNIRIFNTEKAVSFTEKEEVRGKWELSSPEVAANTSALAFQFAQMLQEELNVPVGIIISAWGGTPINSWTSGETLKNTIGISLEKPDTVTSKTPAAIFNGMVAPLSSFTISGFLWYQGENDHKDAEGYRKKLPAMVLDWRSRFGNSTLPFYFVQIAPWRYDQTSLRYAAFFRQMQQELSENIPYSGIAITTDVGSNRTIHPPDKTSIAHRLVILALAKNYGRKLLYKGPEFRSMQVKGNRALLQFRHAKGLYLKDSDHNFLIAGEDRVFYNAKVTIQKGKVIAWADEVQNPVAVRYAFENYVMGSLFNGSGLPASTFRTDKWKTEKK